jgi:Protein of unknown function (DUF3140)
MLHLLKFANTLVKTREDIFAEFRTKVNMSPLEIEKWLETKTSKALGQESCQSAFVIDKKTSQKIIKILLKRKVLLTKGDYECMEKVVHHIDKLYEHKPEDNMLVSNWRYALMNLGHDPFKVLDN